MFELCPTALLFGMWDSTGPKGGLGAKFERAMVGEIIGVDAVLGVNTSSRIDPLGILRDAGPIYRRAGGRTEIGWTLDVEEAVRKGSAAQTLGKDGRPSEANHGNIVPSLSDRSRESREFLAGGVTVGKAEQTLVLSLPALRRLRFPVGEEYNREVDVAGRTVLAGLGLVAAALAEEKGLDLRSRCLLVAEDDLEWELLDRRGPGNYTLSANEAIAVFDIAVEAAKDVGLRWREEPLKLTPSEQLVQLVVRSQNLAVGETAEEGDA